MQGDQVMRSYEQSWTANPLYEARRLYSEALKVDPDSARITTKLALTYLRAYSEPAVEEFADPEALSIQNAAQTANLDGLKRDIIFASDGSCRWLRTAFI